MPHSRTNIPSRSQAYPTQQLPASGDWEDYESDETELDEQPHAYLKIKQVGRKPMVQSLIPVAP